MYIHHILRRWRKSKKEDAMQYLVQLRLKSAASPKTREEGVAFIEQYIYPTLELGKKLQEEKKILAGGPVSGTVALAFIVSADSAKELDDAITGLPVWPVMDTEVTPLSTFDARKQTLLPRLEQLKAQAPSEGRRTDGEQ
jgi:muconolactone delta-isomerase